LNTTWTTENFLKNAKRSFSGTVVNSYDSLDEEEKNTLRMAKVSEGSSKKLCKDIKIEFIGAKLDSEEKIRKLRRKINNIEFWDMRYLENHIAEFSQSYYKIGYDDTNLGMFYDILPYPINLVINAKHIAWLERSYVIDTLSTRISYRRKCVNDHCHDL